MLIGYARTSTADQTAGLDAQLRDLQQAGAEKIYMEQISSVAARRPELDVCLDYIRDGDTLVITRLDRLARSIRHLLEIVETLRAQRRRPAHPVARHRHLHRVRQADPVDPGRDRGVRALPDAGKRQKEGIAKAQAAGKYKGRKPVAHLQAADILALRAQGLGTVAIAERLRLHRTSVYRVLREHRVKEVAGIDFGTLSMAAAAG